MRCGFKTIQHFSRKFEAYTNNTPKLGCPIQYSLNDKGRETKKILERFTNAATKYNDKLFQMLLGQSVDDTEDDGERMRVTIGEDEIECIEKLISVLEQVDKLIRYYAKYQQLKLTNIQQQDF